MDSSKPTEPSFKSVAVKGVAMLSAQNVILQVIWFLTSLALLNSVSLADYGVMKLVFVTLAVPSALFIAGIDPIVLADMGVERERGRMGVVKGLFRSYVYFELISAVCIWMGFVACVFFAQQLFSPVVHQYLLIASFSIFGRALQNIIFQFFSIFFLFKQTTVLKLYDEVLSLIAIVYFVFYLKLGIGAAILIQVVSPFIAVLLSLPALFAAYRTHLRGVRREPSGFMTRLRSYGKWGVASAYASTGWDAVRAYCIKFFLSTEAFALFSLADALWGHLIGLFPAKTVLSAMMPQRSVDESSARNHMIRSTKYTLISYVMLAAIAAIAGYPFLTIFFPAYVKAFPIFLGFMLLIPRTAFGSSLAPLLRAYKLQHPGFVVTMCIIPCTAILAFVLYRAFGMTGVVVELAVTNTVFIYLVYRWFVRRSPSFQFSLKELFTWDASDTALVRMFVHGIRQRMPLKLK